MTFEIQVLAWDRQKSESANGLLIEDCCLQRSYWTKGSYWLG